MVEAGRAEQKLAELMGRLGGHFARVEAFRQAGKYVRGLMGDIPWKNCWALAEYAGDSTPDRMQRLLTGESNKIVSRICGLGLRVLVAGSVFEPAELFFVATYLGGDFFEGGCVGGRSRW